MRAVEIASTLLPTRHCETGQRLSFGDVFSVRVTTVQTHVDQIEDRVFKYSAVENVCDRIRQTVVETDNRRIERCRRSVDPAELHRSARLGFSHGQSEERGEE